MLSRFAQLTRAPAALDSDSSVVRQLWKVYKNVVLPVEERSHFGHFHLPAMSAEEMEARPQVLFLGQYSTGKTSMIKWLTGVETPHFDIRPQPSTDKFMAIVHGDEERLISGNAAICLPQLPYQGLTSFGGRFLSAFQALVEPVDILKSFTVIDTPGVLSGSKQTSGRDYDFTAACRWLSERSDLILLMFDAHKLDPSDELKDVMQALRPQRDKVRCVLNKADQIDAENLVRVYGALTWNVGQILQTPEVARVYISSFWDREYEYDYHKSLFDKDKDSLLLELQSLPRTAIVRKINSMVARIRLVKTHYCIMSQIRSGLSGMSFFESSRARQHRDAVDRVSEIFKEVQQVHGLSPGDMPDVDVFRQRLGAFSDLRRLPLFDASVVESLDAVVATEMPRLVANVGGVSTSGLSTKEPPPALFDGMFTRKPE